MTRKLILHIGSPKCGSTYLQRVLIANRDLLALNGINYPESGEKHPGNGMRALDLPRDGVESLFGQFHTAILSHEDLFSMGSNLQALGPACEAADVALIVQAFLRPFSEVIYGDYSQFMKQNIERYMAEKMAYDGQSFEEFAVTRRSQITPVAWLNAWAKVSSQPIRLARHRDIRATLDDLIGPLPLDWTINRESSNPSLRVTDCEDIASAIRLGIPGEKIREFYKTSYAKVSLPDRGRTEERSRWLEALFKSINEKIIGDFGFDNSLQSAAH